MHPVQSYSTLLCLEPPRTELSTLSLHDALPISGDSCRLRTCGGPTPESLRTRWRRWTPPSPCTRRSASGRARPEFPTRSPSARSEEHTSELQSLRHLVCRLLLEKKKQYKAVTDK